MKIVGNWTDEPVTLTQTEGGVEREYVIPCGESLSLPLDDAEQAEREAAAAAAAAEAEQRAIAATAQAWVALRMKRDRWLAQTDAFFVSPRPSDFPADKAALLDTHVSEWLAFRQALRDLPANTADPHDPPWPAQPAEPVVYLS